MSTPSSRSLATYVFGYGNLTFGGGSATIGSLHRQLVDRRGSMTQQPFDRAYALSRVTPGTSQKGYLLSLAASSRHRRYLVRAPLRVILLVCIVSPSILRAQIPAADDSVTALFARLIVDRTVAAKRADTAAYRRLIDPAAVYLNDDGSRENADQHVRHILKRGDELEHTRWVNDSMHVYVTGDLAFIDYHVLQHRHFGPRDFTWPYGCMDTYVRRNGHWLLLRHAETHAVALPTPQAIDARMLDEYVGRYEWWSGYVDVISRHGNQLFNQGTGDEKAVLNHAATPEAFYVAGDASLIVFIRDKTGRVVGYVLHWPDGQVTRARKLPDPSRALHGQS